MASSGTSSQLIADLRSRLQPLLRRPYLSTSIVLTLLSLVLSFRSSYKAYLALGPGGPPYNVVGWFIVTILAWPYTLSVNQVTWTGDYPNSGAHESILSLPERKGGRAKVGGIAPHRQLSQKAPEAMRSKVHRLFNRAAENNPRLLQMKRSHYERLHEALYVHETFLGVDNSSIAQPRAAIPPPTARISQGEIGHVHTDLSIHLYFSPADAKVIIEKGWGERHRLARSRPWYLGGGEANLYGVAPTYLLLYGSRDDEDFKVLNVLVKNAIRFMTGVEDVDDFAAE